MPKFYAFPTFRYDFFLVKRCIYYANSTVLNLLSQQVGMFSIKRIYRY